MTKAYKYDYDDEMATPVSQDSQPDVLVTIEGLRPQPSVGEFTFSLDNVKRRHIDWSIVAEGLGMPEGIKDQLADDLGAVIWRHDLVQILADRIKPT